MKSTGVVRKLDDLRRLVIPKEVLDARNITKRDALEVFVDGELIILRKYSPGCTLCGSAVDPIVVTVGGNKKICRACATVIRS